MLIDSLSLLLAFTSFISWQETLAVALLMFGMIYSMTPVPQYEGEIRMPTSLYLYLHWSWLGYTRLKDAFWPFFLFINSAFFLIDYWIQDGSFTVGSWVTVHIILAMPLIYWTGAVWRCSDKCSNRYWAVLARLATISVYCDLALRYVIYQYFPNIMFNCEQMILQWGDC